ncbi:FtsK/SpoIIIE domain-containing protein [Brevibacillus laterosporus]|uniref:FtsK/SpoIIIE domain-containing protein n=2 Tax=Brevibacillus laterosporus TaxID=1465 RepID=UPI001958359C|nr:FtsK/SpoIIIE domain-containing protein [Brevibacillus laterosporus]MBM7108484.1 FtsK/SpoIIIE family protein [Brevibacillus laterosporus]
MKANKGEKFVKVSAFSKVPLKVRYSSMLLAYMMLITMVLMIIFKMKISINAVVVAVSLLIIVGVTFLFVRERRDFKRSTFSKLYNFIFMNRLYENEFRTTGYNRDGYPKQKFVIVSSICFSYKETAEELTIRVWKRADRYSERANKQDLMLSALFEKEIYKKCDNVSYCDYVFELISDERLDLRGTGSLTKERFIQMTKKIGWELGKPPHTLIVGGTNSGKTYLVSNLILKYLYMGAETYIIDPKDADLAMIGHFIGLKKYGKAINTATGENEIARLMRIVSEEMDRRYQELFSDETSIGKTWRDFPDVKPIVLVFDELPNNIFCPSLDMFPKPTLTPN